MKTRPQERPQPVESAQYDNDYFLSKCGGADWFKHFIQASEKDAYPIYRKILSRVGAKPSQRALDVGCGRGEVAAMLALAGLTAVALDFSAEAIEIGSYLRRVFLEPKRNTIYLVRGEATLLPFNDRTFDSVILADIVEHLHQWQLALLYPECHRVLRPTGRLLIHTWPNKWHTKYTYPLVARLSRLMGTGRPLDHRKPHDAIMHVNEQSLSSLRADLFKAGFSIERSWCEHDCSFSFRPEQFLYWLLHKSPGLRLFLADHLWILAFKKGAPCQT
jgi:ubiquinone/menaquinone biosynthesis C-methylase UbiE